MPRLTFTTRVSRLVDSHPKSRPVEGREKRALVVEAGGPVGKASRADCRGWLGRKAVLEKQRMGQAMNAKEFAVCAGASYSTARSWFHLSGFPAFHGSFSGKISSSGAPAKMDLPASPNPSRTITASRPPPPQSCLRVLYEFFWTPKN
jgi:hypothetical protein